jgi:8-oxo-dGTP pyrophosphatase MutT (NUDIX family)
MRQVLDSISAVFLVKKGGALLLQLRDNNPAIPRPGIWVVPGGHCHPGESNLECARREFLEETLYNCKNLHYIDSVLDDADGYRYWLHMYWELYDEKQQIQCMEGQKLQFVDRIDGNVYLKIDFLLKYWDIVIAHLDKELIDLASNE